MTVMSPSPPPRQPKPRARFGARRKAEGSDETLTEPVQHSPLATQPSAHVADVESPAYPALEPKVMAPFSARPGETPRKVQIERKKRLFAMQDMAELLKEQGVDCTADGMKAHSSRLPLESFDNTEYESRTHKEWVITDGEGNVKTPARVAVTQMDGSVAWTPCVVLDFNEEENMYCVQTVEQFREQSMEMDWYPRILLHFQAEDPFVFSRRVGEAYAARARAMSMLRYSLYIDSMPTEDIPPLTVEQINRMLGFALNSKKLKDKLTDTSQLINEINIEYARTMNKIVFDESLKRRAQLTEMLVPLAEQFPQPQPKEVPESGTVRLPAYDYPEQFSEFSFHSFLTKPEVITACVKVKTECNKVLKMSLFNTHYTKSSRLEEFEQSQLQASDQVVSHLKDVWVMTLKNGIKSTFKDVGKGWFNLYETQQETYECSKLKKFINMTKYVMEDTLRYLVEASTETFVAFVERCCILEVEVISSSEVVVVEKRPAPIKGKKPPLLALEIVNDGGKLVYSTPLEKFVPVAVGIFDKRITAVQTIPTLEPMIMESLFWSHKPMLNSVHTMEPAVCALRDRLKVAMAAAVGHAEAYLEQFKQFEELVALDVAAYMADLEAQVSPNNDSDDRTRLAVLTGEIDKHEKYLEFLDANVPVTMSLGSVSVTIKGVREALILKQEQILDKVVALLRETPKAIVASICAKYKDLDRQLKVKTTNMEDVDSQRKLISEVPMKVAEILDELHTIQIYYDALNSRQVELSDGDFEQKMEGDGWASRIDRVVAVTEKSLSDDQARYENAQFEEQESFAANLADLAQTVGGFSMHTDLGNTEAIAQNVEEIAKQLKEAQETATLFNSRESLFEKTLTDYSQVKVLIEDFEPFANLWRTAKKWKDGKDTWMDGPFDAIDPDALERDVNTMWKDMFKMSKVLVNRDLPECANCCNEIKEQVDAFRPYVPLAGALRNPGMRDRHWDKLTEDLGMDVHPDHTFTLAKAIEMGLPQHIDHITKICDIAGKEFAIETALDKMQGEWAAQELMVLDYRETGTYVVKVDEAVTQQLDDHIVMTQSMSFSPYKKPFEERIVEWERTLSLVSEVLDEWITCQRSWMYLEPIFSSDDIMQQLPLEGKRFSNVDRMWRKTLSQAKASPAVVAMCSNQKLLDNFIEANKMLESVQKGLSDYLETKRLAFARFFFLSNDELLQILSQTKNPLAVQPHLRKCFEAISSLDFNQQTLEITAMNSAEGEKVPFDESMYPKGNVEDWLGVVEKRMRSALRTQISDSLEAYARDDRKEWVRQWPAMVVLAVSAVYWTQGVEEGIMGKDLPGTLEKNTSNLMDLTDVVRGDLDGQARMTLGALITIDVHARDVVQSLADNDVQSLTEFLWVSQLRYYWENPDKPENLDKRDNVWVKMVQASLPFGYEYLGNTPRLVITPLTDRCYMTLMGAMHLNLGGAPAGPAGTGKTETTKDLAKAMAKQCVVFNCSDGLDYLAMGKFFKGLASSGAWACFDEFNRIDLEVLSVVAQQILTIQLAIQQNLKRFVFEDTEINLDRGCTVYITMNPGYAGRSELPDNLKALFRPCAMMVPDYALIGEISLYSFGFRNAKALARKMVATFRLCSEQLSSQDHYDYGMRAVKSVITAAGNLKREFPTENEDVLLLRGLRDINVPKFLDFDLPLFDGIITDLFPGVEPPVVEYGDLLGAMEKACKKLKIQLVENFKNKTIQLYEMTIVRHGLMLVGPTCGGKTCCYRVLANAMTTLKKEGSDKFEQVRIVALNPKSITMGQLYGEFDDATHEWTDGVLACYMRECAEDTKPDKKWMMFDGPVDAIWIENMNTVLDDNKKLCLVSGEIIQLTPPMTMMFEVEDLAVASPATVSRCGMVYLEPEALGFEPLLTSWVESLDDNVRPHAEKMSQLFHAVVPEAIHFVRKGLKETVATVDPNLCLSLFKVMDSLLVQYKRAEHEEALTPEEIDDLGKMLVPKFIFAITWSVGGTCDMVGRARFDAHLRQALKESGLPFINDEVVPPADRSMYEFCYHDADMKWVPWMETIPAFKVDPDKPFNEIIVPTADTVRYTYLIDRLSRAGSHVLCVGDTGTGKTLTVQDKLGNNMEEQFVPLFITFSARTSANQTQDLIDSKMDKRRKGVFGPPAGKKYVISVDDMNMPQREKYFAQPPIEILRQWMDHKGWYDRKPPCMFKTLQDIQFVGSMGPPGGGRNPVTNRFLRHFNFISFTDMSDESMGLIFQSVLSAFFYKNFAAAEKIHSQIERMVSGSVNVYNTIRKELLPTPSKSHYTFNLRDPARVVQGVLRADPKVIVTPEHVVALWAHECLRVFADRLINNDDRDWFKSLLRDTVVEINELDWEEVGGDGRLMYGDYLVPGADPRVYTRISDMKQLQKVVEEYLEDYNAVSNAPMKLVMFLDAIEHVSRVCRVIRLPSGNALLLGVGGSGRQSLTRLATYMEEFDLFQIEIAKGYDQHAWRDDLKKVLKMAGSEGKDTTFLFTDTQIVQESFLEDINNILNSGEVPNLYGNDDLEEIAAAMRPIMTAAGMPVTKMSIYNFYIGRVRSNLHVVLCMSPIGDAFRQRLRMFPALVNCCTIDWFSEWPDEALRSVANSFFADVPLATDDRPDMVAAVVASCVFIHQSVERKSKLFFEELRRYNYVTPTSYLELLTTFIKLVGEKRDEIETMRSRLQIGLDKLQTTAAEVEVMKKELVELQPVLATTSKEVEEMMLVIAADKEEADKTKEIVSKQEADANKQAAEAKAIADDAQADLDKALPALDAAVQSLKMLSRNDIVEVKSLSNPPEGVKLVMEVTCIFFEEKPVMKPHPSQVGKKVPDYWDPSKKLLNDPTKFLDNLMQFDKDNIPQKVIDKVDPYMEMETFTPENIARVSKACTSICMWARAMHTYHNVALGVEPKRQALAGAQQLLDATMLELAAAQAQLKEVQEKIQLLESNLAAATDKKAELARQVSDCTTKLERAEKLIGGLGGEKARWGSTITDLSAALVNVVGDVVVASGAIAYSGPFTPTYRTALGAEWMKQLVDVDCPHSEHCGLIHTLQDPVRTRQWVIAGLPSDNVSIENGIIVSKARRWPLMIDPQGQANKWIKNMEKESGLDVIKLSEKDFLRTLENGVRFGRAVLLENIGENLDAALEPLLLKQTFKQGGSEVIKIGDNIIPYHPDFRFYMTTKYRNPHYAPEVSVKVSLLNFFVTPEGLEEQLLAVVVLKERPDLAEQKNQLVVSNAKMKKDLKEIEDKILFLLSNSQGNILDDEVLIETLAQSKVTSNEIGEKVAEAEKTEKVIDDTREQYRPVALRASLLFFCIADLALVDPMYQYSLMWFVALFIRGIDSADQAETVEERGANLNEYFTYSLYVNVCRSLFENHKLMFSMLLTVKILQNRGLIDALEWRFLLAGATSSEVTEPNPAPSWMVVKSWIEILNVSKLPVYEGFSKHVADNIAHYKHVFDSTDAHREPIAEPFNSQLTTFQKLCYLRCLRPDKIGVGIMDFVTEHFGSRFIEPPPFDLGVCYKESAPAVPLIFVLSAGADPMADLLKLAEELKMMKKFEKVSLGQGQGPKAEKLLALGMDRGMWVCLQNCHLSVSWMPKLEQIVENMEPDKIHKDFRLWLTSMPSPDFPVSILQNGVKMTLEPPKGLKSNLTRAYFRMDDAYLSECEKPAEWRRMLFGMCLFHAVIQDRRKFGPLGWNIRYDFTDGDLGVCNTQIRMFLNEYDEIPFQVIRFLSAEINYGGRVTDGKDRRLIANLLESFCNASMLIDGYKFSPSGTYVSPDGENVKEFREHIKQYPITPKPEIFGLHENADITCDQNETYELFATVLSLQPRVAGGGGLSREEVIENLATDILSKIPTPWDVEDVGKKFPTRYDESMNTVLTQECIRYNALLITMKSSLVECSKALKGLVVMSPELELVSNALYDNLVPGMWEAKAYPSLKPLSSWTQDLVERCTFISDWIAKGSPPSVFWISGFFFPQAFLTGALQNFARKFHYPIDTVAFDFKVRDDLDWKSCDTGAEDGVYIRGLYMEGARWDSEAHLIGESRPKELYTDMPIVWLKPQQNRERPADGFYDCPIYKTLTRAGTLSTTGHSTNFVMEIEVPSDQLQGHWINRGVALFCALSF